LSWKRKSGGRGGERKSFPYFLFSSRRKGGGKERGRGRGKREVCFPNPLSPFGVIQRGRGGERKKKEGDAAFYLF